MEHKNNNNFAFVTFRHVNTGAERGWFHKLLWENVFKKNKIKLTEDKIFIYFVTNLACKLVNLAMLNHLRGSCTMLFFSSQ